MFFCSLCNFSVDLFSELSDAFSDLCDLIYDFFKEVHLCSNSRLLDLFVVRIPTAKLAKLSRLLASIVHILWTRVIIRLVKLRVLARMFSSSTGLLTI